MNTITLQVLFENALSTPYEVAFLGDKTMRDFFSDSEDRGILLVDRDESGDVITARFPLKTQEEEDNLRALLYGARETGQIPSTVQYAILPDGQEFSIDI
jgi:hypothetical protein